MSETNKGFRNHLIAAIILYATVLVYQGYQYGQGDQTQILPCLWAQDHPGAYANDHYVQSYLASGINERTIFHFLLRHLGYDEPWIVFLWHALFSMALIIAWIRIASLFIKNEAWQWLSIGLILTLGVHTATGSNEIYYNSLVPSLSAKAFASWALYAWLKDKYSIWAILLIVAGYLQPLVGLQLFLLTSIALVVEKWRSRKFSHVPWMYILLYCLATLPWVYELRINNGGENDPVTFMNIIQFRLSHHFFASSFGWIHLLLGLLFAIISIWFYKGRIRWFLMAAVAGCAVYEIGVEMMRWPLVLYTQWWKTTIWVEAFAFIASIALFEKNRLQNKIVTTLNFFIPIGLLILVCVYRLSGLFGEKPPYMFPWSTSKSQEVDISEQAHRLTAANSVFIIPPDLTAFRWYSKRDTYVDYKPMLHTEAFLNDWYHRIDEVYGYNISVKAAGYNFSQKANETLNTPSFETIEKWKRMGITHLISRSSNIKSLNRIGQNKSYSIYNLQPPEN